MRDVRSSPPPVPEDARRRAINRAHADVQKTRKDAKAAKRMRQILAREGLDQRRRQQRKDGLPLEESPSTSLSTKASDGDDGGEAGRGPLDHLPDVVEVVPGALASSPALPGGGGEADPGPAVARSGAEADTPEAWALGKRAISPVGSVAVVERVAVETTPPPPQWTKGAPGSIEDRPAPMDTEATPLPPPPPLRTRFTVAKQLSPRSRAGVPLVVEAPGVSEAEATEATAPTTAETTVAMVGVSASAEATMAEAEAPETIEAIAMAAMPSVQEAEMKAAEALVAPLVQGPPLLRESTRETEVYLISFDDTSRAREVVDAEDAGAVEQPMPILDEGGSALVRELET
ncbi:uncharacterized protein [Miscanthus floridulus]|uniref:uncharacterized protein n=1 Tax=Miscanthus floridulus TaxID=154761 RepID=UPI003457FA2E